MSNRKSDFVLFQLSKRQVKIILNDITVHNCDVVVVVVE